MDDGNAGSKNANTSNKSNYTQYVVAEFISDNNGIGHDGVDIIIL
jgi:hypothetical protein